MQPKFLGGAVPDVKGKDRREVMAKWLASAENPYFATNLANIVWAHFLAGASFTKWTMCGSPTRRQSGTAWMNSARNSPTYNYDFKKLVRDICTSRTYQLSTATNETNASDDAQLLSRGSPPDASREHVGFDHPSHRHQKQIPRAALRRTGRANRQRQHVHLLPAPRSVGPAARRFVLAK